jgi:cell division protein FtsB
MNRYNKFSKKKANFLHSPLMLLFLFCVIVLFSYNTIGLYARERETNKNKEAELNKIDELEKRKEFLSGNLKKLDTPEGTEEAIRDKFEVVKPGEKMVVIVDDTKNQGDEDTVQDHSFWGFIKRLFTKNKN